MQVGPGAVPGAPCYPDLLALRHFVATGDRRWLREVPVQRHPPVVMLDFDVVAVPVGHVSGVFDLARGSRDHRKRTASGGRDINTFMPAIGTWVTQHRCNDAGPRGGIKITCHYCD